MNYLYQPADIIAFDKTLAWMDMVSILAAEGDGPKLKSFILLKGGNCDVEK